jgi:hypothetical protein
MREAASGCGSMSGCSAVLIDSSSKIPVIGSNLSVLGQILPIWNGIRRALSSG